MKAFILTGGLGTRLRSVVSDRQKTMALVAGKPFLEYQISLLKKHGITDIVFCVGYMADSIKNYFGDGSRIEMNIIYSEEDEPLGTAGAIKKAEKYVEDTFIVINGDTFTKLDFSKIIEFHKQKNSIFTIGLTEVNDKSRYGSVDIKEDGLIVSFNEKVKQEEAEKIKEEKGRGIINKNERKSLINCGVYIFNKEVLNYIPKDKICSFEFDILPKLVSTKQVFGYKWNGYFIDLGVPDSYAQLNKDVLDSITIKGNVTVKETMQILNDTALGVALIVGDEKKLLGLVTDGDIRRFIIKEDDLSWRIKDVMITKPITAKEDWNLEKIHSLINPRIKHIPIVDENNVLKDIVLYTDLRRGTKEASIVRAKAPLRISFAGGGTDIEYYFKEYNGMVLNTAINKFCYSTLIKRDDKKIKIVSYDLDIEEEFRSLSDLIYNGKLDLIKSVIKRLHPGFGFDLYLQSDVPPGTGLGSSASMATAVAGAIIHFQEENLDSYKLAEITYKAEREELCINGGWQDQYAAVLGGFNFIEFTEQRNIVYPLRINKEVLNELKCNLILCFIGTQRSSGDIHLQQEKTYFEKKEDILPALNKLKEITLKLKDALLRGRVAEFGELLHDAWENKKRLNPRITNSVIDFLYDIGIKNGAYGGKILGAGGGGYLLFFISHLKRKKLTQELEKAGGTVLDFDFESKGLQVWPVREELL